MYRRILVGFDGSAGGRDGLALARGLAAIEGAELRLVACVGYDPLAIPADDYERAVSAASKQLREAARELLGETRFELQVLGGISAPRALTEIATADGADVIVIGSTHRGPVGRVLPGSVGDRLLAGAPCAVMVAPRDWSRREALALRSLGVGYDGRPEAAHALAVAEALAAELGASVEPIRIEAGDAAAELVERSGGLDLLVIGSRSYGPLRHALLGGVSAHVIRSAACPVLVVPRSAPG